MENKFYTITKKDLFDLFARLALDHDVYVPYRKSDRLYFDKFDIAKEEAIELGVIRQSQPFKSFINASRSKVFDHPRGDSQPKIVAGVKGCDLSSLLLQDYVFMEGDYKDPFYVKNRGNTTIIANDCTMAKETCFCIAMEGAPYPQAYFDMALSPIDNYFLVEVSTAKGMAIIDGYKTFFKDPDRCDVETRDSNRGKVSAQVRSFIDKRGTPHTGLIKGAVANNYANIQFWKDFSSTCVECGACNLICPTCHCFLLCDSKGSEGHERSRIWDACLYNTFARVAGGANPRRHLYERLRNRFEKKFDFFPKTLDYYACTGCGRCIEACPGDIDLREVLKGLVNGIWNKPPNE